MYYADYEMGTKNIMRMRKKPNLIPRMERCAYLQDKEPEQNRGRWLMKYPASELQLELGCGKGRFTVETAAANPNVLLIAVERVPDAMVVAMERADAMALNNVRFIDKDAALLRDFIGDGEVSCIYINFPDPWDKKKQAKRRLTAPSFLRIYEKLLNDGGKICFKTDNRPLFDWSLEQFESEGWSLAEITNDLHANGLQGIATDYELKFYSQGIPINRLVAEKKNRGDV